MKKVLFICATSKMVLHFRMDLIKKYQSEGYAVSVVAFDDTYAEQIKNLCVDFYSVGSNNRSLNPFTLITLKRKYGKIIKKIQPDVVFTFMLKPNVFGVLAAKKIKVNRIYSMIEGLGDAFTYKTLKWRIICRVVSALYKKSLKIPDKVIFLNGDDMKEFISRKLIVENKAVLLGGIGVNLSDFKCRAISYNNCFLMVARLNVAKGVYEYLQAAKEVKAEYPETVFGLLGGEGPIKVADIKEYIQDGTVVYYGETDDVRPYLKNCSVFVLPSYREGFPMSIMEAAASSRATITCDSIGCRDAVENGYSGFVVESKNVAALKEKMIYFIENPKKAKEMGENARKVAEERFDQRIINERIYDLTNG